MGPNGKTKRIIIVSANFFLIFPILEQRAFRTRISIVSANFMVFLAAPFKLATRQSDYNLHRTNTGY